MKFKKILSAALLALCVGISSAGTAEGSAITDMQKNSSSDFEKISQLVTWERQSRVLKFSLPFCRRGFII